MLTRTLSCVLRSRPICVDGPGIKRQAGQGNRGRGITPLPCRQVEVARLTLELKEAEMQRDDAESKKASEQQTVNALQVSLCSMQPHSHVLCPTPCSSR